MGFDLWASPHFLVVHRGQITLDAFWRGLEEGLAEARAEGVRGCVVVDAVNHFGPKHGHAVLDLVLPGPAALREGLLHRRAGRLAPSGTGPRLRPGPGRRACASPPTPARTARGRMSGRRSWKAASSRIVHGIRADDATLDLLAERRIPVDICPTSNGALAADVVPHPLPRMLRAGVRCALGTDDPGVIPCDLATEATAARSMGLDDTALAAMRRNGAEDAWCLLA